jgi:hypothetical protein
MAGDFVENIKQEDSEVQKRIRTARQKEKQSQRQAKLDR